MTSPRRASSPSSLSAGGQDEQPCEVNSSTTMGRLSALPGDGPSAMPAKIPRTSAIRQAFTATPSLSPGAVAGPDPRAASRMPGPDGAMQPPGLGDLPAPGVAGQDGLFRGLDA